MMNIAIIPARGGSKRIPYKNIKLFYGKPIIAYSIEAAIESGCFDEIIVSTDDVLIAQIAKKQNASVPFIRPDEISNDVATTMDVMRHAATWLDKNGYKVTHLCCLYATAPFITANILQQGLKKLETENCDFVFAASKFDYPIERAIKLSKKENVSLFFPKQALTRSQDLQQAYHDAGLFYWGKKEAFLKHNSIFSAHSKIIELARTQTQDIDTMEDWLFAEALYKIIKNESCNKS